MDARAIGRRPSYDETYKRQPLKFIIVCMYHSCDSSINSIMSWPQQYSDESLLSLSDSDDDDKASDPTPPTLNLQTATLDQQSWNYTDESYVQWLCAMQNTAWCDSSMDGMSGMDSMAWLGAMQNIAWDMHHMDWQLQTSAHAAPPPPTAQTAPPPPNVKVGQSNEKQPPWNSSEAINKYVDDTVKLARTVMTKGIKNAKEDDLITLVHRCYHMDTFKFSVTRVCNSRAQNEKDLLCQEINDLKKKLGSSGAASNPSNRVTSFQ